MLLKLKTIFIIIFLLFGCSSNKKNKSLNASDLKTANSAVNSGIDQIQSSNPNEDFENQQLNYEIKKLNSEINYLKEQVTALDIKSSLYADPFDVYNKEIMLNNGSSIFCKIISQSNNKIFVETLIGNLTIDRVNVVRIVENITVLEDDVLSNEII